jgi:hypothetical protein
MHKKIDGVKILVGFEDGSRKTSEKRKGKPSYVKRNKKMCVSPINTRRN